MGREYSDSAKCDHSVHQEGFKRRSARDRCTNVANLVESSENERSGLTFHGGNGLAGVSDAAFAATF